MDCRYIKESHSTELTRMIYEIVGCEKISDIDEVDLVGLQHRIEEGDVLLPAEIERVHRLHKLCNPEMY